MGSGRGGVCCSVFSIGDASRSLCRRTLSSRFGCCVLLVCRWEGGGGLAGARGRRPGGLGEGGVGGVSSKSSSSEGRIAGRKREIEMFSELPPGIATLKELSSRDMTRYGPMKGDVNDGWVPPRRTITCVQVLNSSGMNVAGRLCAEVWTGCSRDTSKRMLLRRFRLERSS